jgi:hypothetical protein
MKGKGSLEIYKQDIIESVGFGQSFDMWGQCEGKQR